MTMACAGHGIADKAIVDEKLHEWLFSQQRE